ncbi:hypothetical protein CW702_00605 [Candidatus Bathyarchaeota archaeon]|nr:MAG: hypothetical protein CW702_00605 [Candidatus Bathyarchaeota archaeon]
MKRMYIPIKTVSISLLVIVLLINFSVPNLSQVKLDCKNFVSPYSKLEIEGYVRLKNKTVVMNQTVTVGENSKFEIVNSTIDFRGISASTLILNYGELVIRNSSIITDLNKNYSVVIASYGRLSIVNSKISNVFLPVNFKNGSVTYVQAVSAKSGEVAIIGSTFENYTIGILIEAVTSPSILNNTFIFCPFGVYLSSLNFKIDGNLFLNSLATAITASGFNGNIVGNYILNDRDKLIETLRPFGDVTIGVDVSGINITIRENIIGNTYKCIAASGLNHCIIEGNRIFTNGSMQGEMQIEYTEYAVIRNNTIINQWDPIEIYNSRHLIIEYNVLIRGSGGIRCEKVDESYIKPKNVTIRGNVLLDAGFIKVSQAENVRVLNNLLNNSFIYAEQVKALLIHNNTIKEGTIIIENSEDIQITNNYIKAPEGEDPIELNNCKDVAERDNIIYGEEDNAEDTVPFPESRIMYAMLIIATVIVVTLVAVLRKTGGRT